MSMLDELIEQQICKWESESELRRNNHQVPESTFKPIVTVSRQRGSSGSYIARRIADKLGYTYFNRQFIDTICNNSDFRRRLVEALDGDSQSKINGWIKNRLHDEFDNASEYFRYLYHTILLLAHHGGLILLGRGSNFVLTLNWGFHIRVVAPMKRRVEKIIEFANVDHDAAMEAIEDSDRERADFIESNYRKDINDPHYYDLVLNTGIIDVEDAVRIATTAIKAKFG